MAMWTTGTEPAALEYVGGPASSHLAMPNRDHDVRGFNEPFSDQDIDALEVGTVARKRDDLVGCCQSLLESVDFFAERKVIAVFARLEGQQRSMKLPLDRLQAAAI
jgi:hypothetical protein